MFSEKMMEKLKSCSHGKMSDLQKEAKLDILKDLSDQAGEAMSVKIMAKPEDMENALDMAKEKVEEVMEAKAAAGDEDEEESEEEMEDESEESEPDMGEEMEEKVEDFSKVDPEELDAQIERLMKMREKMKVASMD